MKEVMYLLRKVMIFTLSALEIQSLPLPDRYVVRFQVL